MTQVYVDSVLGSSRFHLKIYFKLRGTVFCSALTFLVTKKSLSLELHDQIASSLRSPTLIMLLYKNDISRTKKQNNRQGSRIAKLKHHEIYQIVTELKKESKSVPKTLRNMRGSDKLSSQYI